MLPTFGFRFTAALIQKQKWKCATTNRLKNLCCKEGFDKTTLQSSIEGMNCANGCFLENDGLSVFTESNQAA